MIEDCKIGSVCMLLSADFRAATHSWQAGGWLHWTAANHTKRDNQFCINISHFLSGTVDSLLHNETSPWLDVLRMHVCYTYMWHVSCFSIAHSMHTLIVLNWTIYWTDQSHCQQNNKQFHWPASCINCIVDWLQKWQVIQLPQRERVEWDCKTENWLLRQSHRVS